MIRNIAIFTILLVSSSQLCAQPRGPGGHGPPDPSVFLARMDANGDGEIAPDEISERARPFIIPRLREAGLDTSKSIKVDKILKVFEKMREKREKDDRHRDDRRRDDKPEDRETSVSNELPDFSFDDETSLLPDFSLPDDSPLLQTGPLEDRYSREVMERTERTLRERDRNRDGVLDEKEIRDGRWSPPAHDSDLNKDGRLTKIELAERYKKKAADESRYNEDRREEPKKDSRSQPSSSRDSGSSNSSSSKSSSSSSSKNDKIVRYADAMIAKYDKNKNGALEKDEWGKMRGMSSSTDANGDGKVSRDELIVKYGGKSGGSSSVKKEAVTRRIGGGFGIPTLEERLEKKGVSSKFIESDSNKDGNLQMSEFSDEWDDDEFENFDKLDTNRDGVISPTEWIERGGR